MKIKFLKFEGAGNDFILPLNVDYEKILKFIPFLCDRKKGIGADGILFSLKDKNYDFRMLYFNADGSKAEFCANGARCLLHYNYLKRGKKKFKFIADDGEHEGEFLEGNLFKLKMVNPVKIKDFLIEGESFTLINSGVPHLIEEVSDLEKVPVFEKGRYLRFHKFFKPCGTNVDFIRIEGRRIFIRTYERGVEEEVFSCGTGAVASAFYAKLKSNLDKFEIYTKGGDILYVEFTKEGTFLIGPSNLVFEGSIELKF